MPTRKTTVEIDEELLEQAREVLDTDTIKETVNSALVAVIRARARRQEVRALRKMEGLDLDDDEIMKGAWTE